MRRRLIIGPHLSKHLSRGAYPGFHLIPYSTRCQLQQDTLTIISLPTNYTCRLLSRLLQLHTLSHHSNSQYGLHKPRCRSCSRRALHSAGGRRTIPKILSCLVNRWKELRQAHRTVKLHQYRRVLRSMVWSLQESTASLRESSQVSSWTRKSCGY